MNLEGDREILTDFCELREERGNVSGRWTVCGRPDVQRNSFIKEQKNSFFVKGSLNSAEKAIHRLEQRLNRGQRGWSSR